MLDLDNEALAQSYHNEGHKNAYDDIKRVLEGHGFTRQQGSVYFGEVRQVDAVSCVLAVMDLAKAKPWFAPSVRDIRMLRIEEISDLMPAVLEAGSYTPGSMCRAGKVAALTTQAEPSKLRLM